MDLPATQAVDDEDFAPTQRLPGEDRVHENTLIGTLIFSDDHQPLIYSGSTTIGRQPDCTIILTDVTVSKCHAEIEAESINKAIFIRDLGSSNRTKINDTKLKPHSSYQIKDNDKLNFGKVAATFKLHQPVDDSFVACTPQVNRRAAVIPDTPETSMENSSMVDGEASTIPGTQADTEDTCFRRPQIPVRTSISNEHESPQHGPFTLDEVPSPLSNSKDHNDISEVETQRFAVDKTKEMTDNTVHTAETKPLSISHNLSVKKVLSEVFANQSLEDVETQQFVHNKSDSNCRRLETNSNNRSKTQEDQSVADAETEPFISEKSTDESNNPADVSIHSAATQKVENVASENELMENLETQLFTRKSINYVKRKSANTSIYSAETQKIVADISNQALHDIRTQNFISNPDCSKIELADVSIYSAATQKVKSKLENGAMENLGTQKIENSSASISNGAHHIADQEKLTSGVSFSIEDVETMPFTKFELPLDEKSSTIDMQNEDDNLLDSDASTTKFDKEKKVQESGNSESRAQIQSSLEKSDAPVTVDEINDIKQNQDQTSNTFSKPTSKNILQSSSKFDKSKSLVESDDEEEIFSQNLIENSPFHLLLDDSKNSNERSASDLQNDEKIETEKIVDAEYNDISNKQDNSMNNENSTKNKSTVAENDDSETDEEGAFSTDLIKENKDEKSHEETGNDSETDEEGVFTNHLTDEKDEKSSNKPEGDSETDEEGVFSGHLYENSKEIEDNKIVINRDSESEDEGISYGNQSKNKASNDSADRNKNVTKAAGDSSFVGESAEKASSPSLKTSKTSRVVGRESPAPESDDDLFNENNEETRIGSSKSDRVNSPTIDKGKLDSVHKSSTSMDSRATKSDDDNNDVDELAPTQIVEADDLSLAPTQIVNSYERSNLEEERSKVVDELAPTQLIETQILSRESLSPTRKATTITDSSKKVAQAYDDMNLAPTQKMVETQECAESLASTQLVVDTQPGSEEMGALQFSESLAPTQIVETQSNDVENEIVTSPKASSNVSKRQLEEVEITSNKKQKTEEVLPKVNVDLNSTVEQNLNEMFEGTEEKIVNIEEPIETQQLTSILESSQIEESSATTFDVSVNKSSPTLSTKRSNMRYRNRRRPLTLNKSSTLNETSKSIINLNDTIEKNLNELFDNSGDSVETQEVEPEPMLTQQLESMLDYSQDRNPNVESKEEEGRTLSATRRKSRLSLSMNLNNSMLKTQKEKEAKTTSQGSLNEITPEKEDYSVNLDKDNAADKQLTNRNDKAIVYRRGTIGFTNTLDPVSTFDRIAFFDKYSSSDSQSDGDDLLKLRSPSSKQRVSLRLKNLDLNSSLSSSQQSDLAVEKKKAQSPAVSSKKKTLIQHRFSRQRVVVVRLSKLASPLYRKYAKPDRKRVMACGTVGWTPNLDAVESEELVSAASTESEDDLKTKDGMSSPKIDDEVDKVENDQPPADSPMEDYKNDNEDDSEDEFLKKFPEVKIANTVKNPITPSQIAQTSDHETDTKSMKSVACEIPESWKWFADNRLDRFYEKYDTSNKKNENDSESENDEHKENETNNDVTVNSMEADLADRRAKIDKILAEVEASSSGKKRESNRIARNTSRNEDVVIATRSQTSRKLRTPSPKPSEDESDVGSNKPDPVQNSSSSSDSEDSDRLSIFPKYKPISPLNFNYNLMELEQQDDGNNSEDDFAELRSNCDRILKRLKPKASPLNKARRSRRKSACNDDIKDVTQSESGIDDKKRVTPKIVVGTVDKSGVVFQVPRDSKKTPTATTSRTAGSTKDRTNKRIIDSDNGDDVDDDQLTHHLPSPKRTKTEADRQKLQQLTVVISPLGDRLIKLRDAKRLNVANASAFKQPNLALNKRRNKGAATKSAKTKTLDSYVTIDTAKAARTNSSDLSAVENSIVEDESEVLPKTRGRLGVRNKKAKVDDTPSMRHVKSSKENTEECDVQKTKTSGRAGKRNQTTDSSPVSERDSSKDEISASSVENKRSTRGRLVRQNKVTKAVAKETIKDNVVVDDSDSEESTQPKITVRKNRRAHLAKNNDQLSSSKIDVVAGSKNDTIQDKTDKHSQSLSQPESVTTRTTRARKTKLNQESDTGSSDPQEVAATRGRKRKAANDKSDMVAKITKVNSNKESMTKTDESEDEVNVYKLMKKKMNIKAEEPTAVPARKTRARATKDASVVESSSEESQEVSEIMKVSALEDSKTTTRRRGRHEKSSASYVENTESSDDIFEKPTVRPKRARLAKADKDKSSHMADSEEDSTLSAHKSTRRKDNPSPSLTPPPNAVAALTPSRVSRLSLSPSRRPKVLFTGEKSKAHCQILTKLGGVKTEDFNSCSVLITDKVRRTFKFLCSLARGIPIASVKWLEDSKKANRFLDLEDYILNDPKAEAEFKFNLKESLNKSRKHKLLEGYTVVLTPKIKQPPITELKKMVTASGGEPLVRAPAKWPEKSVVITTEQDLDSAKKLIAKAPKSVTAHSIEFILTGILRQDTNFNEFKL